MRRHRSGFTLIELVLVVAIFLIVTMLGFGLTRDTMPRYRARKAAAMFMGNVSRCRMLAIEVNRECRVLMGDFDGSPASLSSANVGLYYVQIGNKSLNSDTYETLPTTEVSGQGTWDLSVGSTDYLRNVSILEWSSISGTSASGSESIVFSPRGFVTNPNADFNDGYIQIDFVNKVAYAKGINDVFNVKIARTGMTRLDNPLMNEPYPSEAPGTASTSTSD